MSFVIAIIATALTGAAADDAGVLKLSPDAAPLAVSVSESRLDFVSNSIDMSGFQDQTAQWRQSAISLGENSRVTLDVYEGGIDSPSLNPWSRSLLNEMAPGGRAALESQPSWTLNYEQDLISGRTGDYDFAISPHAVVSQGPRGSSAGAGAIARIGQNLRKRRADEPSWYFFAGADAEAITLDPRQGFDLSGGMRLQDQVIVGDAQAGVAWSLGDADIAVAYVQKERRYESPSFGVSRTDGFAALSFSVRR